jgi:two-component system, chemotaxis family, protein-glutamate methylesterase/glutaminase
MPTSTPGIVVIASSAGGIEALTTILQGLPQDFPVPIVVVQHRPRGHRSHLVSILRRQTKLHVKDAIAGDTLHAGTVYLAKPDEHLTVTEDLCFQYVESTTCIPRQIRCSSRQRCVTGRMPSH